MILVDSLGNEITKESMETDLLLANVRKRLNILTGRNWEDSVVIITQLCKIEKCC